MNRKPRDLEDKKKGKQKYRFSDVKSESKGFTGIFFFSLKVSFLRHPSLSKLIGTVRRFLFIWGGGGGEEG